MKVTQGPTIWKGIELIPVGTKVKLFDIEWFISAHCHSYYALKFERLGYTGKTTVAFKSTESLRKSIVGGRKNENTTFADSSSTEQS